MLSVYLEHFVFKENNGATRKLSPYMETTVFAG